MTERELNNLKDERTKIFQNFIALEKRINEIDEIIKHATNLNLNWTKRAMDCLRGEEEPMTSDDILRCVFRNDPQELQSPAKRRNYMMKLSFALNQLCAQKLVAKEPLPGHRGRLYYLATWVNPLGEIKAEYRDRYDRKLLKLKIEKNREREDQLL